jgi:hypothetical protein
MYYSDGTIPTKWVNLVNREFSFHASDPGSLPCPAVRYSRARIGMVAVRPLECTARHLKRPMWLKHRIVPSHLEGAI